jgi:hypothetical protein
VIGERPVRGSRPPGATARRACLLGAGAAVAATAGDLLLLWVANAQRPELAWLPVPPERALLAGHLLGTLAIPLFGVGYWGVSRGLPARVGSAVFALGAYGGALGGAVHAATAMAEQLERASGIGPGAPLAFVGRHGDLLAPLWLVLAALVTLGSVLFAVAVARGGTAFPRGMAAASPLVLLALAAGLGAGSEVGRAFLVPAAPNAVHVAFFALAALALGGVAATPQPANPDT